MIPSDQVKTYQVRQIVKDYNTPAENMFDKQKQREENPKERPARPARPIV